VVGLSVSVDDKQRRPAGQRPWLRLRAKFTFVWTHLSTSTRYSLYYSPCPFRPFFAVFVILSLVRREILFQLSTPKRTAFSIQVDLICQQQPLVKGPKTRWVFRNRFRLKNYRSSCTLYIKNGRTKNPQIF